MLAGPAPLCFPPYFFSEYFFKRESISPDLMRRCQIIDIVFIILNKGFYKKEFIRVIIRHVNSEDNFLVKKLDK